MKTATICLHVWINSANEHHPNILKTTYSSKVHEIDGNVVKLNFTTDDTKTGHAVVTKEEVQIFRDDFKNLAKWATAWQMLFNYCGKCCSYAS